MKGRAALLTAAAILLAPGAATAQTSTTATSAADLDDPDREWTTDVREASDPGLDLPRLALELPTHFIELMFAPLLPVAVAFERFHLVDRLINLLTNDPKTLAFIPVVEPFNSSGLGVGGTLVYNEPLGSQDRVVVLGLVRTNRDRNFSVSFSRRFPSLSGRVISFGGSYGADHDTRYYGVGGTQEFDDRRVIRIDSADAWFGMTLINPSRLPEWTASAEVRYRRRRIGTGRGPQAPGLLPNDVLPVPPGFRRALDYPELSIETTFDSRDSLGRTTEGLVANLRMALTHDVNGGDTGGILTTARLAGFIPVLPRHRVLFLSAGLSAAVPVLSASLPLHHLPNLGGSTILRGYDGDRFIDRLAWWATAEYRFPLYEYQASSMTLSGAMFLDTGQVGEEPRDLVTGPYRWSVGFGLRAEQNLILLGRVQAAISPEGFRFSVGFGEVL